MAENPGGPVRATSPGDDTAARPPSYASVLLGGPNHKRDDRGPQWGVVGFES